MATPFSIHFDDAPAVEYDRESSGLDCTSRRLIKRPHAENVALYHATVRAPIDYGLSMEQELVYYGLEGAGTVYVDGRPFELAPGRAVLVPGGAELRHTADEDNTFLIAWGPAPPDVERHH
jgi:hypothetical protein